MIDSSKTSSAILLTTAIVTAFLAMLAAYAIVRYVIVKPVLHLKDVSDEIARGNLDLRADIHTGDEFEELSQAFNRMLRHMMTVQDELRDDVQDMMLDVNRSPQATTQIQPMSPIRIVTSPLRNLMSMEPPVLSPRHEREVAVTSPAIASSVSHSAD